MIRELQLDIAQGWPWWSVALITAIVLGTMALFYRRASERVSRGYLILLMVLRSAAMLALLLCLFRPALRYQKGAFTRAAVLMLVDRSQSMSVRDFAGQPSRFERVREALLARSGPAQDLDDQFRVQWFTFGATSEPLESRRGLLDAVPDAPATDLVAAARSALGRLKGGEIAGVVLLTDGVQTTTASPASELPRLGAPVYTVGVGSVLGQTEQFRDIAITRVAAQRDIAVRTTLPVKVSVASKGFRDRVVPLLLKENGVEIGRQDVVLQDSGPQTVLLKYTPQKKGDFELTVEILPDPSERVTENNLSTFPVWVGDPRLRVLFVEGVVRIEYKDLHRVLQLDPQIEMLSLIRTGKNLFLQQGNIQDIQLRGFPDTLEALKAFNVLILGSIESEAFSKEQLEFIKRFVTEGGGFMMLGGEHAFGPGGYGDTPLNDVLPVEPGDMNAGQEREPFPLTLTPIGRAHPIFAGIADFFPVQGGAPKGRLPDLLGCTRVTRPRPASEVLAIHPRRANAHGPLTALAAGQYGAGRTLAATYDSTYLWYRPMSGLGKDSPYVRYWGQAMRWLAGVEETRRDVGARVSAYADRRFYEPGDKPQLTVRVTDAEGQVTDRAEVVAEVRRAGDASGRRSALAPVTARRGDYEALLDPLDPAKYEVVVTALLEGKPLGEATVTFRVGEPTREFERLDLDEALLRSVASESGGRYLPLLSLNKLPEILRSRQEAKIERVEIFLWNNPVMFGAFLLLLTVEWVLRRMRLLS